MPTATLTSKGQVTLPLPVRQALDVHSGDQIDFTEQADGSWVVTPMTASVDDIFAFFGPLNGSVPTIDEMDAAMIAAVAEANK